MNFKKAAKKYREAAGADFIEPNQKKSVARAHAWLLSDGGGQMIALVTNDGVLFGMNLKRWNCREREAVQQMQEDACR